MLLLLVGASGVGKTTIAKILCSKWGFRYLSNFTTRKLRDGENERFHISNEELDLAIRNLEVAFVNEVFGNRYGVMEAELQMAISTGNRYLFDIDHRFLHKLEARAEYVVFILPQSEEQVINQLKLGNRNDRIAQSIQEQRAIRQTITERRLRKSVVVNRVGEEQETAETIALLCASA